MAQQKGSKPQFHKWPRNTKMIIANLTADSVKNNNIQTKNRLLRTQQKKICSYIYK